VEHGPWCLVRGSWFIVPDYQCLARDRATLSAIDAWLAIGLAYGSRIVEHWPRTTFHVKHWPRITDHGPLPKAIGSHLTIKPGYPLSIVPKP